MGGLFTCQIKKMALGKFDWNPLKTWKPEFQQGKQVSAFSKVSTKLMSSLVMVTSWFLIFFPLVGGWGGSFVFDKKRMFVN